jgi:predicted N-acetyltransferase YhbS
MNIVIRPTVEEDAMRLAQIQRDAFLPIYEKYQDKGNPCLRGPEDILNRLQLPQRFLYFTILNNDDIVGGIMYRKRGGGFFFPNLQEGEYYLQRLYVDPKMQRRKIASTAIEYCEKKLCKQGATAFYVDFPKDLNHNKLCFESIGFVDTGKELEVEPGLIFTFYEKIV